MHSTSFDRAHSTAASAQSAQRKTRIVTKQLIIGTMLAAAIWSTNSFAGSLFLMNFGSLIQVTLVQTEPAKTELTAANTATSNKEIQDKKRELSAKESVTPAVRSMRSTDNKDSKLKIVIM